MKQYFTLLIVLACLWCIGQNITNVHNGQLVWNGEQLTTTASGGGAAANPPSVIRTATNWVNGAASLTITNFDCTGGNYLVVAAYCEQSSQSISFSSATNNGTAMTILTNFSAALANFEAGAIFGKAAPTTGDIVIKTSVSADNNGITAIAVLLTNVASVKSVAVDATSTLRKGLTNTVTTASSDLVLDSIDVFSLNTIRENPIGIGQNMVASCYKNKTPNVFMSSSLGTGSSVSMCWTNQPSNNYRLGWIGVVLSP